MFAISSAQMSAIRESRILAFEDRTRAHLKSYFPRHCQALGEESLRRAIRLGLHKAKGHDLTAECCVRSYIEFMCLLGSGFDADPLLPWAAAILNDKFAFGQVARGDRLHEQGWEYVDYVAQDYRDLSGQPAFAHLIEDFAKLFQGRDEVLTEGNYPAFARQLAGQIEADFPAKCRYVGEIRLQTLIPRGIKSAWAHGLMTERELAVYTVLLFVLGSGFADDPLFPWASSALNDPKPSGQIARTDRLHAEGLAFLGRWWPAVSSQGASSLAAGTGRPLPARAMPAPLLRIAPRPHALARAPALRPRRSPPVPRIGHERPWPWARK